MRPAGPLILVFCLCGCGDDGALFDAGAVDAKADGASADGGTPDGSFIGCTGPRVATLAFGLASPNDVALWQDQIYVAVGRDGTVRRIPTAGGPLTTLVSGQPAPWRFAVDADSIYWLTRALGKRASLR